jgi:hypothetical protein
MGGRYDAFDLDQERGTAGAAAQAATAVPHELEPRLLMSADAGVLGTTAALQRRRSIRPPRAGGDMDQHAPAPVNRPASGLIIIDSAARQTERLLANVGWTRTEPREIVVLQSDRDGVQQLSEICRRLFEPQRHPPHFPWRGRIFLGSGIADLDGVLANARAIRAGALTADGDL